MAESLRQKREKKIKRIISGVVSSSLLAALIVVLYFLFRKKDGTKQSNKANRTARHQQRRSVNNLNRPPVRNIPRPEVDTLQERDPPVNSNIIIPPANPENTIVTPLTIAKDTLVAAGLLPAVNNGFPDKSRFNFHLRLLENADPRYAEACDTFVDLFAANFPDDHETQFLRKMWHDRKHINTKIQEILGTTSGCWRRPK